MIKGSLKADSLELLSFKVDPGPAILTKIRLVDTRTGIEHAVIRNNEALVTSAWGDDTLVKVKELQALLERDLAKLHMRGEEEGSSNKGVQFPEGGIGEHLSTDDAPSI